MKVKKEKNAPPPMMVSETEEMKVFNNTQTMGIIAVIASCILFLTANVLIRRVFSFDYISIMFMYLAIVCFYSYAKFRNIYHFIIGLGFAFVFLCTLIMYLIGLVN